MCDPECMEKFQKLEVDIALISADMKWIKGLAAICVVILGGVFGIDMSGVV